MARLVTARLGTARLATAGRVTAVWCAAGVAALAARAAPGLTALRGPGPVGAAAARGLIVRA
jgi:hypothetical protein